MQDFQSFHFTLFCAHCLGLNFHYGKYAKMPGSERTKVPWKCYEDVETLSVVGGTLCWRRRESEVRGQALKGTKVPWKCCETLSVVGALYVGEGERVK